MRVLTIKRLVAIVAIFPLIACANTVLAQGGTAAIQKELEAAKVAAAKAQADLKKAEIDSAAAEKKLAQLKAMVEKAKLKTANLTKQQQTLAVRLDQSQTADRLLKVANAAATRSGKAQTALTALQTGLQKLEQDLAARKSTATQMARLIKDNEAKVKPQQDAIAKAKTAKDAADKAAAAPRKAIADANKVVTDKKATTAKAMADSTNVRKSADAAKKAAESLKSVIEIAKQAAAAAKGTAAEKATADSVVAQIAAAKKVAEVSVQLEKKAATLAAALKKSQTEQTAAEAALKKATDAAKPQLDAATKADAAFAAANSALAATQQTVAMAKPKLAEANEWKTLLQSQVAALGPSVEKANVDFAMLNAKTIELQKQAEEKLIGAERLVSFSDKVAPIFAQRCLACHNARIAKGRYNMESFAAIIKGGESGEAISPGHADQSNLFALITEGEMPKDADPLSKAEIETIRKWINTGGVLNAGVDQTAQLIQIVPAVPQPLPPDQYRVPMPVTAVAFSADGKRLATSGYHEVLIWDASTGKQLQRVTNVAERVYDIEFSPDGATLAVAAGTPAKTGELKIFSLDGKLLADLIRTDDSVFSAVFSRDGRRLASSGADRTVRVFDTETYEEQLRIEDHADWVMDVAWAPDGKKLASASRDKTAKVFDAKTGDSLVTFNGHGQPVFGVGFLPDGSKIVTGGSDKQLRVWNVSDAKEVRKIGGFGNEVFRIDVTADGFVYSSSADKTARLHNLADGKETKKFVGHTEWVYSVAYSPATKRVATGSYNGEVRIWNPADGKSLLNFVATPGPKAEQTVAK